MKGSASGDGYRGGLPLHVTTEAAAASRATEGLAALATVQATMPVADAMVGAFELACKRYGHSLVDMIAIAPPVRAAKSVPL